MYEILLGSDSDDKLFERLQEAIQALDGKVSNTEWALAGSQETTTYKISFPSGILEAVAETYIGITLRGPENLVIALANKVNS
jgi:hypothetical protein